MSMLVVGSVALDSIKTPFGKRRDILGGSATFFSLAASFFCKVDIVAAIGEDFPGRHVKMFCDRRIGTEGLTRQKGKTFRWAGYYKDDMNTAHTISTHLNVFGDFDPKIPTDLRDSKHVFLANIYPDLQASVLSQVNDPEVVACDSMNYWIENKRRRLVRLIRSVDIFLLNDSEAKQLSGESNILKAAKAVLGFGPRSVIIKRGEYGVLYFSRNSSFAVPAYLLESVCDPTGAGDTFAGGMMGFLCGTGKFNEVNIRKSIVYGNIVASFAVEDFGVAGLLRTRRRDIEKRRAQFRGMTKF
jgi:sugar/nucleoside kinase (ribokinase family)